MNRYLFGENQGEATDTTNAAGGVAYKLEDKHALAQYANTGCFNKTFYTLAEVQLTELLAILRKVEDLEFIAKCAIYSRQSGFMKDSPAFLAAYLSTQGDKGNDLLESIFPKVINDSKMLRNFCQIIRSGVLGRSSFGSRLKRLVANWIINRKPESLFRDNVGQKPSVGDVINMVHPRPMNREQGHLFGYILGQKPVSVKQYSQLTEKEQKNFCVIEMLPELVRQFEAYKIDKVEKLPDVPFQMLTSLDLTTIEWMQIARNTTWKTLRMNLNTFARHDVFKTYPSMINFVADKIRNKELIAQAKVFPYQILAAFMNCSSDVPQKITNALQDAMDLAVVNVPALEGNIFIFPDVSWSMQDPITGYRKGSSSKMKCIDVAALISSCVLKRNPDNTTVIPVDTSVHLNQKLNPRDSIMTNTMRLAAFKGGGTALGAALEWLNTTKNKVDSVIFVSDNESWADTNRYYYKTNVATQIESEWKKIKSRNKNAKLVCIDLSPKDNAQIKEKPGVLNIGGFSDNIFKIIGDFFEEKMSREYFVKTIENVEI